MKKGRWIRFASRSTIWLSLLAMAVSTLLAVWSVTLADTNVARGAGGVLSQLESGRFDLVLHRIDSDYPQNSEQIADLLDDLKLHQKHTRQWSAARRQAFEYAIAQMIDLRDDAHIEDALMFAIEAQGLAEDAPTLLKNPQIVTLVDQALALARQAEAAGDWVKAMSLYRRLDLLFDQPASEYRKNVDRVMRHIHVMRIYIPDQLTALYEKRAEERGEQFDAINLLGPDTWQDRLRGIRKPMLIAALKEAERRHVSGASFKPMLLGAIDALLVLLDTQGIDQAFTTLSNHEDVTTFSRYLVTQKQKINRIDTALSSFEVARKINRIFSLNRTTTKLPDRVLVYEMTDGAMNMLDEFSSVIWPYELEQFRRNTRGSFYGVGIQISMSPGPLTITHVGSDPDARGARDLSQGDVIVQIGGRDVSDYSPGYVIWKIKRTDHGPVTVGVERTGEKDLIQVTLTQTIDVKIKRPRGRLTVKSPLRGTPAYKAGIQADDVIATVNAKDTSDWTLDQAVRTITGPLNTIVDLGIERKGVDGLLHIPIERDEIEIESVKGWQLREDDTWDFYIDRGRKIGYLRLSQFIPQSSDEMDDAVARMQADNGLEALILDLRFNPGGLLNKAVDVTDRFIPSGIIVSTIDAEGDQTDSRSANPRNTYRPVPVAVLINQTSASASEIVAGALQDYGRALIVGTRSYGKGSVQDLFPIDINRTTHIKLTTQYYRLPHKRIIHRALNAAKWGIEPDLLVKMTDDQVRQLLEFRQELDVLHSNEAQQRQSDAQSDRILSDGMDPQLEAALLWLKTRMVVDKFELARKPEPIHTP